MAVHHRLGPQLHGVHPAGQSLNEDQDIYDDYRDDDDDDDADNDYDYNYDDDDVVVVGSWYR